MTRYAALGARAVQPGVEADRGGLRGATVYWPRGRFTPISFGCSVFLVCRILHAISFRDTLAACTLSLARRYANFGNSTRTVNVPLSDGSKSCNSTILRALKPCGPPSLRQTKSETSLCSTLAGTNTG